MYHSGTYPVRGVVSHSGTLGKSTCLLLNNRLHTLENNFSAWTNTITTKISSSVRNGTKTSATSVCMKNGVTTYRMDLNGSISTWRFEKKGNAFHVRKMLLPMHCRSEPRKKLGICCDFIVFLNRSEKVNGQALSNFPRFKHHLSPVWRSHIEFICLTSNKEQTSILP